jgi:predicted ArsR family transcriptional regulator
MAATKKKKIRRKGQVFRTLDLLVSGEQYTAEDLAHELDISYMTVKRYLKELYMLDLVHIAAWDRKYKHIVPVYEWGAGEDKRKPRPYTRYEITRRYWAKHQEEINARRRARAAERRRGNVPVGDNGGAEAATA